MNDDKSKIPEGPYCYGVSVNSDGENEIRICPYWHKDETREEQNNGYCSFLDEGDWEVEGLSLLWDQCKECGINLGEENDETL